jgi:hypothetical protein
MRTLLDKGEDPVQVKREQRASGKTFGQVCDEWIAGNLNDHPDQPGWSPSQIKDNWREVAVIVLVLLLRGRASA